jgi:hypothetical protein
VAISTFHSKRTAKGKQAPTLPSIASISFINETEAARPNSGLPLQKQANRDMVL